MYLKHGGPKHIFKCVEGLLGCLNAESNLLQTETTIKARFSLSRGKI